VEAIRSTIFFTALEVDLVLWRAMRKGEFINHFIEGDRRSKHVQPDGERDIWC